MADLTMLRTSPLAHLRPREGAVTGNRPVQMAEVPFLAMLSLRVDPTSPAAAAIEEALGAELPRAVGQLTEHGPHQVLWLGPDEWLVVSRTDPDTLSGLLTGAVGSAHAAVVDVSANRTVVELSGPAARAVLEKGCPLDLHPREFLAGTAVSTTLARIPLLLWKVDDETYWLLPRASFADYVARWLLDAMQEFGSPVEDGGGS